MRVAALLVLTVFGCSSETPAATVPELPKCPDESGTPPAELRCTGLYSDWATKKVAPEALAYKPGLELWSDGAEKHRYFSLPKGTKIDTSNPDEWTFPVGTKTWKEFRVNGKKVETRFYWKLSETQWVWTTYRWLPDESRSDRLDTGRPNAEGNYEIPPAETCEQCHRGRKDRLLGIEAVALAHPAATGATLAKLKQDGLLSTDVAAPAIPEDATGKASAALGYLHMNCGVSCHDASGGAPASQSGLYFKLHVGDLGKPVSELPSYKTSVGQPILGNTYFEYSGKGFLRIKPGDANLSLVPAAARLRGTTLQMPAIGTREADPAGLALLDAWINALPPK